MTVYRLFYSRFAAVVLQVFMALVMPPAWKDAATVIPTDGQECFWQAKDNPTVWHGNYDLGTDSFIDEGGIIFPRSVVQVWCITLTDGTQQDGVQFRQSKRVAQTAQGKGGNLDSESKIFQFMNNTIIWIDQMFDALPPFQIGPPSGKAQWDAAIGPYFGVKICMCSDVIATGKKLHRTMSYMSFIAAGAPIYVAPMGFPLDPTPWGPIQCVPSDGTHPDYVQFQTFSGTNGSYNIIQLGKGNGNPWWHQNPSGGAHTLYAGDNGFAEIFALPDGAIVKLCQWTEAFQPCGMVEIPVRHY